MRRQDIVSILITFVVGVCVGSYLYLYGFSQQFSFFGELTKDTDALVIVGGAYGGCERGGLCASFQLATDGTYASFPAAGDREARIKEEGEISAPLLRELRDTFTVDYLSALEQSITPEMCETYTDGIEYRFRIAVGEEQFELDSCDTALANDAAAQDLLQRLLSSVGL
ncbi:hypothetical protein K2Q16_02960 [Patescibacteria group bacterium]|nr:hypothetical protein [Patescibacteria group bacterium]